MRVRFGRLVAVLVALLAAATLATSIGAPPATATGPAGLGQFMYAVGQVESGGRYDARNPVSGAYGKYQFMPASWRGWAKRYLGDASAKPTPRNQEIVAAAKMTALFKWLGSWRRVAYWWLTGSNRTAGWTKYATTYVNRVMRLYDRAPATRTTPRPKVTPTANPTPTPTPRLVSTNAVRRYSEGSPMIRYAGGWSSAGHPDYEGGAVRYATRARSKATFTFDAHAVTWYGPVGPTRGRARVYVDGKLATTVDLYARDFAARRAVFTKTWPTNGRHTVTIEVVGTPDRPYVAIDELTVAS